MTIEKMSGAQITFTISFNSQLARQTKGKRTQSGVTSFRLRRKADQRFVRFT
jgi:hypothetical protein